MLPDFRFLLAAIALCTSILVFGLGAAALLRAAHQEVAQNPSWRGTPEPRLAQSQEPANPVLAMLRIEPVVADSKIADAPLSPASDESRGTEAEAAATVFPTPDEDKAVASRAAESSPPIETAKTEARSPQASTPAEDPAAPSAPGTAESMAADTKIAAVEQASPATGEQPSAAQPVMAPTASLAVEADPAAARIAALGGPLAAVEMEAAKKDAVFEQQDREEAKKRLRAERAKERRRLAARRAHLAEQAAAQQTAIDPFGQLMQPTQLTKQMQPTQQAQLAAARRKTR
jgi:hypothetical protein